jgi:hypothetical protein
MEGQGVPLPETAGNATDSSAEQRLGAGRLPEVVRTWKFLETGALARCHKRRAQQEAWTIACEGSRKPAFQDVTGEMQGTEPTGGASRSPSHPVSHRCPRCGSAKKTRPNPWDSERATSHDPDLRQSPFAVMR